jgi:glycosyltransferase A (GT-A) superfamily protein (DUF2064 family)
MMESLIDSLIVIAKEPIAGRVKTRLVPHLSFEQAAELAEAALADTLAVVLTIASERKIIALDGQPGRWLPDGWIVVPQVAGGLDARLSAAFLAAGGGPSILVGMDTPQLQTHHLLAANLEDFDACLGRSSDGGYWAIGLREPAHADRVIAGVPMSTSWTGSAQLARLRAAGLRVQLLDELTDVDTFDVACAVAADAPNTRFARTLTRLLADERGVA